MTANKPSNATRPTAIFALTDGVNVYYPQGTGIVRAISLEDLADATGLGDQQAAIYEARTHDVGIAGLATVSAALYPTSEDSPPARWGRPSDPLGFPEDYADALADWLDWCDGEDEAATVGLAGIVELPEAA